MKTQESPRRRKSTMKEIIKKNQRQTKKSTAQSSNKYNAEDFDYPNDTSLPDHLSC